MPSNYLRRVEALEAVLGDRCPAEGCGRCRVLGWLARVRGTEPPRCNNRPAPALEGLREFKFEERQALQAAIDAERERRGLVTRTPTNAQTSGAASDSHSPLEAVEEGDRPAHDHGQGSVEL